MKQRTGLNAGTREKVFEPFFTTKSTGPGWNVDCERIIEAHHGLDAAAPPWTPQRRLNNCTPGAIFRTVCPVPLGLNEETWQDAVLAALFDHRRRCRHQSWMPRHCSRRQRSQCHRMFGYKTNSESRWPKHPHASCRTPTTKIMIITWPRIYRAKESDTLSEIGREVTAQRQRRQRLPICTRPSSEN